jgi:hypothetical protein
MLRALVQPALADWTVATHYYLVGDLGHCTLCGAHPDVVEQVLARHEGLGIATVVCLPCRAADPGRERIRALLTARYDPARFGQDANGGRHG